MSSLRRTLDGDVRIHHLTQDQRLIDPSLLARHGRSARTLVKEGPLRLTIVAIAPGGTLPGLGCAERVVTSTKEFTCPALCG